jgi:glycosyltransferase involved in cell wall biosynthesis
MPMSDGSVMSSDQTVPGASAATKLRVVSIAHTAVSSANGRLRYFPLAKVPDLDVTLVVPRRWKQFGRTLEADPPGDQGIAVRVETILLQHLPKMHWYAHVYPRLGRILAETKPHVLHLWEEPWSLVALQAVLQRPAGTAIVLEVDQNILKRLPPPFESIRRFVLARTAVILSRSGEATDVVRACGYTGPVLPIGYGVDRDTFHPAGNASTRVPHAPLRLGYAGRLVVEKGLDDALVAMTVSRQPWTLSIMGEGPYEQPLRERAASLGLSDRVTFEPWSGVGAVAGMLRSIDVSLLLTRTTPVVREQFGRAITESQACGVPVIGSTCGAIPDVVGGGGWIVPESDPAALAALIDRLSAKPGEIVERRVAGLANVTDRFTFEAIAGALERAWRLAATTPSDVAKDKAV